MGTIRVHVVVDPDELRKWAGWHADHSHHGVAAVLYRAVDDVAVQSAHLDRVLEALRDRPGLPAVDAGGTYPAESVDALLNLIARAVAGDD